MVRAWIILSTLVLGVLFKLWKDYQGTVSFPFSSTKLPTQSWIYFLMEHVNAIAIASCLLIHDNTPRWLLWIYFYILVLDLLHYVLFFRDEGIGFNLVKVLMFSIPLLWIHLKQPLRL
jgi:hypothetical protein